MNNDILEGAQIDSAVAVQESSNDTPYVSEKLRVEV